MMKKVFCGLLVLLVSFFQVGPVFSQRPYEISGFIETLEVGRPIYYENLTVIPVYSTRIHDHTNYATLDEALSSGWLTISEMGSGSVNEVMLTNHSKRYIYVMGGEILTGCRQDRIVGRDVLIAPGSRDIIVSVYCVEEGRWTYRSDKFYSKNNLGTYKLRAQAQEARSNSQSNIWLSVRDSNQRLSVRSSTQSYQEAYDDRAVKDKVISYERRLQCIPNMRADTVGVVIAAGGQITSADIFASPQLFRKLWPKILRSSAFSSISCRGSGSTSQRRGADFLSSLRYKNYYRRSAIGLGEEFYADNGVSVNALCYRNAVLHLAAFPEEPIDYSPKYWENNDDRIPVNRR